MPPSVPTTTQQPTPSLAIARRGGFLSSFFLSQRTPTTTTSHVGSSLSSASIVDPQRVITTHWGLSLPLHLQHQPHRPPSLWIFWTNYNSGADDEPCRLIAAAFSGNENIQERNDGPYSQRKWIPILDSKTDSKATAKF